MCCRSTATATATVTVTVTVTVTGGVTRATQAFRRPVGGLHSPVAAVGVAAGVEPPARQVEAILETQAHGWVHALAAPPV